MNRRTGPLVGVALIVVAVVALIVALLQAGFGTSGLATSGPPTPEASFPPLMAVEDLYAAFEAGGSATSAGEPTSLSTVPAGDLVLPTGRIVAADVFFFTTEPFTRRLPAGRHPVLLLSSARDPDLVGDVAAAMIRVAPGDPVSWELAVVPGQEVTTLQPDEFFGYPVDSGTGAFASAEAVERLATGDGGEAYAHLVSDGLYPSDGVYNMSVDITVDPASGTNVIGFPSGFGDGGYPSWFGLDADGEPLVLLTDFGILDATSP
ncbi:MAG: DUF4241 domain-containing protein [Candidatus Limnocylindrales bacterium]